MNQNDLIKEEIAKELDCDYYKKDMERGKKKKVETAEEISPAPIATERQAVEQEPPKAPSKPKYRIIDFDPPKDKEMAVFTVAKKLSEYIFVITEKSPKKLRWSIVGKLQGASVELIENLYRANFSKDDTRLNYQKEALVLLNLLDYFSETAFQMRAITLKQVRIIALQSCETKKLLHGWMKSDGKKN